MKRVMNIPRLLRRRVRILAGRDDLRHKYILLAAVLGTERVATIIVDMQVDFIANACRAA
jgi:hypothetical protein